MVAKSKDSFLLDTIGTLVKRAANRCSNPLCGAITSGPAQVPTESVNVGEAAHIRGAHPGSARYEGAMTAGERSDIANAIWLCANCHTLIDSDRDQFTADVLLTWKAEHEARVAARVGKAGGEDSARLIAEIREAFAQADVPMVIAAPTEVREPEAPELADPRRKAASSKRRKPLKADQKLVRAALASQAEQGPPAELDPDRNLVVAAGAEGTDYPDPPIPPTYDPGDVIATLEARNLQKKQDEAFGWKTGGRRSRLEFGRP